MRERTTDLEVCVLGKTPGHVTRVLPHGVVLVEIERRGGVEVARRALNPVAHDRHAEDSPLEADHIGHCAHGEIRHDILPARVDRVNDVLPVAKRAPVRVEHGEIERGVACAATTRESAVCKFSSRGTWQGTLTVCLPEHVDERCARDENALDAHALEIVKLGSQTS